MPIIPLPKLELISIHIPKTAGTSFRNILDDEYGTQSVLRLDIAEHKDIPYLCHVNQQPIAKARINYSQIKVIHGHFQLSKAKEYFDIPELARRITWLRNPVERVLSNYFYLKKIVSELLSDKINQDSLGKELFTTISEFAERDVNRNRMHRFIESDSLADFDFVGCTEHFENDIVRLKNLLNWKATKPYEHNVSGSRALELNDELHSYLSALNEKDELLYRQFTTHVQLV